MWYIITFFVGAFIGMIIMGILASAGQADEMIERMADDAERKDRENDFKISFIVGLSAVNLNPKKANITNIEYDGKVLNVCSYTPELIAGLHDTTIERIQKYVPVEIKLHKTKLDDLLK